MPIYEYFCKWCESISSGVFKYEERPATIKCEHCDDYPAEYIMGAPSQFKIGYEQNGRKAVQVNMGNGKKLYRSKTREQFEHNIGNLGTKKYKEKNEWEKRKLTDSVYTKGYREHLKKEKKGAN